MESMNAGRVAIGVGAIHNPPRAQYSEETRDLIKVAPSNPHTEILTVEPEEIEHPFLMEESKLTMMQRRSIQDAVDRGEPLPPPTPKSKTNGKFAEAQVMFPCVWKKRSQEAIAKSGAYDRDQFRRTVPLLNKEKQKRHLACMMAYGQDMPPTPHGPKILHRQLKIHQVSEVLDPLDDLVKAIEERMEFMNEMECLGQGKKYRPIIQQEIAQKLRLMETMDKKRSTEIAKRVQAQQFKQDRGTPKPLPLGEIDC